MKFLTIALLLCQAVPVSGREALDRPNVVVIYLDDSGYGDYSHNGNPVIETPNISKIANGGVNFTQFYIDIGQSRIIFLAYSYFGRFF